MDDPQPRCRILRKAKVSVRINCLAKILHRNLIELACGGPRGKPVAADGLLVVDNALRDLLQLIGTFGVLGLESINCCFHCSDIFVISILQKRREYANTNIGKVFDFEQAVGSHWGIRSVAIQLPIKV